MTTPAALEIVGVSLAYTPGRWVLRDVSLSVAPGERCMVLGPSGSGKSTLLRAVKGFTTPAEGRILVGGAPVRVGRQDDGVAWIPQNLGLVRTSSVLTNVLMGALSRTGRLSAWLGRFSAEDRALAYELLDRLGIRHKAAERVAALSGGERQRVAIARALMQRPRLVLADEFVSHLDRVTTADIMAIVESIAAEGVAFLITSHHVELVAEYGDRAIFLRGAAIVHDGPAADLTTDAAVALLRT